MYELSNQSNVVNTSFTQHTTELYALFTQKQLTLPPANEMILEDYRAVIQEIYTN